MGVVSARVWLPGDHHLRPRGEVAVDRRRRPAARVGDEVGGGPQALALGDPHLVDLPTLQRAACRAGRASTECSPTASVPPIPCMWPRPERSSPADHLHRRCPRPGNRRRAAITIASPTAIAGRISRPRQPRTLAAGRRLSPGSASAPPRPAPRRAPARAARAAARAARRTRRGRPPPAPGPRALGCSGRSPARGPRSPRSSPGSSASSAKATRSSLSGCSPVTSPPPGSL